MPKYLEWLAQTDASVDLWQEWLSEHSLVIEERKYRLVEEFGSEQGTNFLSWGVLRRVKRVVVIVSRFWKCRLGLICKG